jgi:hypothetical protein
MLTDLRLGAGVSGEQYEASEKSEWRGKNNGPASRVLYGQLPSIVIQSRMLSRVRVPRCFRPVSYSEQLVSVYLALGMLCRFCALYLCGIGDTF